MNTELTTNQSASLAVHGEVKRGNRNMEQKPALTCGEDAPTARSALFTLMVNRQPHTLAVAPDTPLLYVLRNDLGLNGPKFGCGLGECGACTVLVDGVAARACVLPVQAVLAHEVTTLEGLGSVDCPSPVQQAFIDQQAAQCGYCLNGMIMTVQALLNRNPHPSEAQIRRELKYNLCRCGTHVEILAAARQAAGHSTEQAATQATGQHQ